MVNKIDLAYIAGIVDGEGYIGIGKNCTAKRKKNHSIQYMEVVSIGMNDINPLRFIYNIFGGYLKKDKYDFYRLVLSNITADIFLKKIYPFLKVKSPECKILFKLRRNIDSANTKERSYRNPKARMLKSSVNDYRKGLYEQIKRLHS